MQTDQDLEYLSRSQLKTEVKRLRDAIRQDRDSSGHDLCHWRPELWGTLPEGFTTVEPKVPSFWEFMIRCFLYRWNLGKGCEKCTI
jgi:hypothetical protein